MVPTSGFEVPTIPSHPPSPYDKLPTFPLRFVQAWAPALSISALFEDSEDEIGNHLEGSTDHPFRRAHQALSLHIGFFDQDQEEE